MIKGTYIFYLDGKEILRSSNVITKFGKRFLTNFIAGRTSFANKSLAVGIDSTPASDNDTRLGFEFYRLPIEFGSTDISTSEGATTYTVVFKTTVPQDISGEINEIGLYPEYPLSLNNYSSKFIAGFDNQLDWTDSLGNNPDYVSENNKIGSNVLQMESGVGNSVEFKTNITGLDISGYSSNDSLRFAYYQNDTNLNSIVIKFYSSLTDYYSITVEPNTSTGYVITDEVPMSSLFNNPTGSPDSSDITQIGIEVVPDSGEITAIGVDALRVNDEDTFDPNFGIISRSVLSTPLNKLAGRQVDIEYRIDLGF